MMFSDDIFGELFGELDRDSGFDDRLMIHTIGVYNTGIKLSAGGPKQTPAGLYLVYSPDYRTYLGRGGYVMNPMDDAVVKFEGLRAGDFEIVIESFTSIILINRSIIFVDRSDQYAYVLDEKITYPEYVEFWYRPL